MEWNEHLQLAYLLRTAVCASVAYLIGCFTTGYYLMRFKTGQDIREMGSGSTGARNVGRFLGKGGFFLTALGDFFKGSLAVWLVRAWSHDEFAAALAVLAVVIGHLWPMQLKFHGGKGVTTSMGALLVFDYRVAFTLAALFIVFYIFTRKNLLPAMFAFVCLPVACWYYSQNHFTIGIMTVLSATILFAHRKNLGEEFNALKSESPKL